jgi:serine/threonine protein phosphatase PrpC
MGLFDRAARSRPAGYGVHFHRFNLQGRQIHVVHVGDTRLYRLRGNQFQQLTVDHTLGPGKLNLLSRAVGADDELRIDYVNLPNEQHDR